jgi:membrane associated rhomboid family serine protease
MACMASTDRQTMVCYRHPRTETAVRCSNCDRPICTDCMVFSSVGIKCPECAGQPAGVKKAAVRAQRVAGAGTDTLVTKILVGIAAGAFLLQVSQASDIAGTSGTVFRDFALDGPDVAAGDWWRLLSATFLHAGPIHLLFNGIMLWWFGRPLEQLLGRGRFLGIFLVSALAGSAGALLVSPNVYTVGASGAVFGILGAGLVLERRSVPVFGGSALLVIILNLALTFTLNNISIGGHIGGLVGGALAMLALTRFGRRHAVYGRIGAVEVASLVGLAALAVSVAYVGANGFT